MRSLRCWITRLGLATAAGCVWLDFLIGSLGLLLWNPQLLLNLSIVVGEIKFLDLLLRSLGA